jgi:hypothetical protein
MSECYMHQFTDTNRMTDMASYFAGNMVSWSKRNIFVHERRDVTWATESSCALTISYVGKYQDCFHSLAQLARALGLKFLPEGL